MKFPYLALVVLALFLFGCNTREEVFKTITPRLVKDKDIYDEELTGEKSPLSIYKIEASGAAADTETPFSIKLGDTTIALQSSENEGVRFHKFRFAKFLNDQETCVMVNCVDSTTQQHKFFLIVARGKNIEAIDLYRPTDEASRKINNNENRIGGVATLYNNDIVLRRRDLKVFFLKRVSEMERIPGNFVLQSPDRQTLVFQQPPNKLYQVNYLSGATSTITVDRNQLEDPENFHTWIRTDFSWKKDKKGNTFLKQNDNNEIVEM